MMVSWEEEGEVRAGIGQDRGTVNNRRTEARDEAGEREKSQVSRSTDNRGVAGRWAASSEQQ